MSRIIAIANQKGGVGKTTTCVNLAAALSSMHKRVLLVDLDPQGNATMGCGIDKHGLERSVLDVLVDGMSIGSARQRSPGNGHDVVGSNADLTAAEVELLEGAPEGRERRLRDALHAENDTYDYVLIDCPPSLNILTLNAFVAADSVLVPIQCEYYALEGLSALLDTIEGVRESVNPGLEIEGLLRTMHDGRSRLGVEVSAYLLENFGDQVFTTIVPRNIRLAEAPSHGMSIVQYDRASRGALAYLALAGEIIRHRTRIDGQRRRESGAEAPRHESAGASTSVHAAGDATAPAPAAAGQAVSASEHADDTASDRATTGRPGAEQAAAGPIPPIRPVAEERPTDAGEAGGSSADERAVELAAAARTSGITH